jgi:hypothetical protein
MKTIVKGNEKRTVGDAAAKIAVQQMGWSELAEAKRPSEIGTKTKKPPEITGDHAIKLKETVYPGDEEKKPAELAPSLMESVEKLTEKKTRKVPVKSKSKK